MDRELLARLQQFTARYAGSAATFRGRRAGTVHVARDFLGKIDLGRFGAHNPHPFYDELDKVTEDLAMAIPGHEWGFARKALNIFLRDCLYNIYLRECHCLAQSESFMEVALDGVVAGALRKQDRTLPAWTSIYRLSPSVNHLYQRVARRVARGSGMAAVHLDAIYWTRA